MPRTALVTGASSGIGLATAIALAAKGYRVFGTSRTPDAQSLDGVEFVPLDLSDDHSIEALRLLRKLSLRAWAGVCVRVT